MIKRILSPVHRNIKLIALYSVLFWMLCQVIVIIYYWGTPQFYDSESYQNLAWECFNSDTWYPTSRHVALDKYIFNPGYVNWLIIHLHVFHTLKLVPITNLFFNALLLYSIFSISKRLTNVKVGYYAVVLFCLMYSNIVAPAVILTDLLFTSIIYGSMLLIRRNCTHLFIAGIIVSVANYIRPLSLIFIIPILMYMYIKHFKLKMFVSYLCAITLSSLIIATFNYKLNDHFFVSSTTGGYNLIMGANDDMNGAYGNTVFKKGHIGYINPKDSLDVFEKDRFWKRQALSWIVEHPVEFISYVPTKFHYLWKADDYHFISLKGGKNYNNIWIPYIEYYGYSFVYYLSIIFFFCFFIKNRKKVLGLDGIYVIPVILCSGMHMVIYGALRYHYPFIPIIIFYAAIFLSQINGEQNYHVQNNK